MKSIKLILLFSLALLFSFNVASAYQQMFQVHQDNVKPSKIWDYEKTAKAFHDACLEHNPQASWLCATMDDMTYLYVTPIESFADLDKRPFAEMAKAMGDEFAKMFQDFDQCYDSHGSYIIMLDEELTYMPDGISQTQEGEDYRDYYFIYFNPKDEKNLREGMKAVKDMFASKASKNYYRIYRTGFGTMDSYYLVAMSSKDEIDSATKEKANEELLGPERFETFKKVMDYATKMEEVTGEIRRDLSYAPKKE